MYEAYRAYVDRQLVDVSNKKRYGFYRAYGKSRELSYRKM
jgi:hypothetical protein